MYNVKVNFASGRVLEFNNVDIDWNNNTLAINQENQPTVNVSYHTVETIEILKLIK